MNWLFTPPWNARVILGIALALLVLAVVRWWREGRAGSLVAVRAVLIGALLLLMLNPQQLLPRERAGKPKLAILLDTSASMATRDVAGEARLGAAMHVLTNAATLAAWERDFILEWRRFDRDVGPMGLASLRPDAARGDASDIGGALMRVVSELSEASSQAGVLLVSDGRATSPAVLEAAQLALARSAPLWTWTLGAPVPRRDLWIETGSSEALAFSGAEVELAATLRVQGYPNRSFRVEVLKDDQVIETREVLPSANPGSRVEGDGTARLTVRVKGPGTGEQRYGFRVQPQPDEADTANNERAVFLRAVGERARVLVAEGQPHWDTKFLVQSLKRDAHVDVTAVYRLNANRHVALVSATGQETRIEKDLFPRSAEAINAFDIIVLGRGAEAFFDGSTEALLTDFAGRRGGSLVFARGKPYDGRFQALAKLEPLAWGGGVTPAIRLKPTEAGRDNPIFDLGAAGTLDELLERLPVLDAASVTLGEKPLAVVLASAAGQSEGPVLVAYQRYGQGKVLSLNASGLWRWSFRETGQEESEEAYRRFWISMLQWLLSGGQFLPGADVALTSPRRYYTSDQPMQFLITTRNVDRAAYQPRLVIRGRDAAVEVAPRARGETFIAEVGPFPPGTYRATLRNNVGQPSELSQNIEVVNASIENRELSADPETMRKLAEISGGAVVGPGDVARLSEVVRRWEAARQLTQRQRPVWDRWWALMGLTALLGVEWWLRRRAGLL